MTLDVIVVGGSYAGLSAAMQLARARKRVLVVDSGSPRNRFAHEGHGFFGQDGRPPFDILRDARGQLAVYPTVAFADGEVLAARQSETGFAVTLADGTEEKAARLVLATGVRDELPPIPGLQERWGVSVLHCPYCHGYEVADRALGVLATQPMSVHQAKLIPDWGPTTYFPQGDFEPGEEDAKLLAVRGVAIERSPVVELLGAAPELEAVRLADGRTMKLAALFVAPRTHMASPLAEQLGCAFDEGPSGRYVRVDDWRQTSVPGVYVAGDAATPMHSATLASASGAMAGVGAHQSLMHVAPAGPKRRMPDGRMDDPSFWDQLTGFGSTTSRFTVPFAERALAEAKLAPGASVLGVATGAGALAISAARAGFTVLATDVSLGMVRELLARELANLDVRKMDGQALDLPDDGGLTAH